VDAQLPPVLARWLARDYGVDAEHLALTRHFSATALGRF
jgi:predicted nuclease of predicted toxin-antitoxin system